MSAKQPKNAAPPQTPAAGSVDAIRDIIFGAQMEEYEGRFQALEDSLRAEAAALREDLQKRFEHLEKRLQESVARLESSLESEQKERLETARKNAEKAAAELESAREEIHRRLAELMDVKTDRAALADLLRSVAGRLENGRESGAAA